MMNLKAESDAIMHCVCEAFGVELEELLGMSRVQPIPDARFVGYLLARRRGMSFPRIAKLFKRGDHTTVMSGIKRAEQLLLGDVQIAALVSKFCAERAAYDADALALVAVYRAEEPWAEREKPPDKPVDSGGEKGGHAGGALSDLPPLTLSFAEVPESSPALSSPAEVPVSKPARVAKGTKFVPEDWGPKAHHLLYAESHGLDLELELFKFRNNEFYRPHTDWNKAFSVWLAKAVEFGRGRPGTAKPKPGSNAEAMRQRALRLAEEEKRDAAQ